MARLRDEWQGLKQAVAALDRQVTVVLVAAVLLVFMQHALGDRAFFNRHFGSMVSADLRELYAWGWWFTMQFAAGFVLPVALLLLVFGRKPAEIGLGLGDWKFALKVAALYVPVVAVGTWLLSDGTAFQVKYPHCRAAIHNWPVFVIFELWFLVYWIGWEYLWRGFTLFGLAPRFGHYAIFIQMVPFAILHLYKPLPEALLSVVGGLALGALVWRCRSFWIAVPIHALQMMLLDLWAVLRLRSGVSGIGWDAFMKLF